MRDADEGPGLPERSGVRILEAPGMLDTLLYLRSAGQCKKTELYEGIGRRVGMAVKLDRLEHAGLIVQRRNPSMTLILLTRNGREVAEMIERIRKLIGDGEVRGDRWTGPKDRWR